MTKFSEEKIQEVKEFFKENKGKVMSEEITGIHIERKTKRKFGINDVAEHFGLTESQARRILYVK
jgi:hypothetical protein|tara:strand:- start:42 stop:236 length:195 start_codon:yes stop_codon:yes gene_type:complete